MTRLELWGVPLPGEVRPGDDLAVLLATAVPELVDGDVVVVTSKVVSKAEGRIVACAPDPDSRERARQAAVDAETVRVVAARGRTRIVETRQGFVLAAAGVDASNTAPDTVLLLPEDPDASARRIRDGLRARRSVEVAVVVSDTFGRPWRRGLTDVAVGAAGIAPLRDYRGGTDTHGNPLAMTEMADVDTLAAAAELVKGKLAGVPAAVVRGLSYERSDVGVRALLRPAGEDMFRLGTAEAVTMGAVSAAAAAVDGGALGPPPAQPQLAGAVAAAVADAVRAPLAVTVDSTVGGAVLTCTVTAGGDTVAAAVQAGVLRTALAARGLSTTWTTVPPLGQLRVSR